MDPSIKTIKNTRPGLTMGLWHGHPVSQRSNSTTPSRRPSRLLRPRLTPIPTAGDHYRRHCARRRTAAVSPFRPKLRKQHSGSETGLSVPVSN